MYTPKPGIKTTEFWSLVGSFLYLIAFKAGWITPEVKATVEIVADTAGNAIDKALEYNQQLQELKATQGGWEPMIGSLVYTFFRDRAKR